MVVAQDTATRPYLKIALEAYDDDFSCFSFVDFCEFNFDLRIKPSTTQVDLLIGLLARSIILSFHLIYLRFVLSFFFAC